MAILKALPHRNLQQVSVVAFDASVEEKWNDAVLKLHIQFEVLALVLVHHY